MGICRFSIDVAVENLGGRSIGMIGKKREESEDDSNSNTFSEKTISGYVNAGMIRGQLYETRKSTVGFKLTGTAQGGDGDRGEVIVTFELVDKAEELFKVKVTFNGAVNTNSGTIATIRYFPTFPDLYR